MFCTGQSFCIENASTLQEQRRDLLVDAVPAAPAAPAGPGGPFAVAWRNYVRTVFQKGFMYRLSCKPSVILYIAENKVLAGREDRTYEGEALGRKMAIVFFEDMDAGLVRRVSKETFGMHQVLLSTAEILQTLQAIDLPPDPARTTTQTELLLETHYEHLEILRCSCTLEPAGPEVHVYHLDGEVNAETALALELSAEQRTKMVLARALQRHGDLKPDESLQRAWGNNLAELRARTALLFHDPAVPAAPAAPPAGRGGGGRAVILPAEGFTRL